MLRQDVRETVPESTVERLVRVVLGILAGKQASPAGIAQAVHTLGLSGASQESIERRVRRFENDEAVAATVCFQPLARAYLQLGKPRQLTLLIDPTTQEDRIVMLSVGVWYRGRALPLAWLCWEANTPLTGAGFWQRVGQALAEGATLLPPNVPVVCLADRAVGTPQFTDLLAPYGWHFVVRVQGQTHAQARNGAESSVRELVAHRGTRRKLRGRVFKKAGWRALSVVVWWDRSHKEPLCLVRCTRSDLI